MRHTSMPHDQHAPNAQRGPRARAFTLTELMVAVAILIVVIIATARIFGTVSKVTGAGEANADIMQTAQTMERQIRADLARLSAQGFVAIQNVEVRNDVNAPSGPLLNSAQPANAKLRCDRLVFFVDGQQHSTVYAGSDDFTGDPGDYYWPNKQAMAARVYYGHAIQLRNAKPGMDAYLGGKENGAPICPWTFEVPNLGEWGVTTVNWSTGANGQVVLATQPPAREWILARQALLLADDGTNGFLRFNNRTSDPKNSALSIWLTTASTAGLNTYDSGPFSSRVDIAASTLDKIRQTVTNFGDTNWNWFDQRTQILRSLEVPGGTSASPNPLRFPRAEKVPPSGSTDRIDQMLTTPTLAPGCSSFIVEWTWADRTGRESAEDGSTVDPTPAQPASGDEWVGFVVNDNGEHPWFGMPDADRGVFPLNSDETAVPHRVKVYDGDCVGELGCVGLPIYPSNIEGPFVTSGPAELVGYPLFNAQFGVRVYEAVFGFNSTRSLPFNSATNQIGPDPAAGYTPWPTALRFTFTLHDSQQRFPEGRTFQFVVELPRR